MSAATWADLWAVATVGATVGARAGQLDVTLAGWSVGETADWWAGVKVVV
jgi:hypothetical protein